jgi:predicted nucleotidyltransferase
MLSEVVFVGGCVTELLFTEPGLAPIRVTSDVDLIAEIASYADYLEFSDRIRALGFEEDHRDGAPLCRWMCGALTVDAMPLDPSILGFSNSWYVEALRSAWIVGLTTDLELRVISAPCFLATKMEAFRNRGKGDYFASHDLEDLISVVDGRATILDDVRNARPELRVFIERSISKLLKEPRFLDALPGYLLPDQGNQERLGSLESKLRALSGAETPER